MNFFELGPNTSSAPRGAMLSVTAEGERYSDIALASTDMLASHTADNLFSAEFLQDLKKGISKSSRIPRVSIVH